MNKYIITKIAAVIIILIPLFSWSGCKKQAKCGCGKDILFSIDSMLINRSSIVFGTNGSTASFTVGYDSYYFCNPVEMYSVYNSLGNNNQLLISGDCFWECQYLMNSGSSSYYAYYKVYNIQVTLLTGYLYGKK
jgi:hypothetical protein